MATKNLALHGLLYKGFFSSVIDREQDWYHQDLPPGGEAVSAGMHLMVSAQGRAALTDEGCHLPRFECRAKNVTLSNKRLTNVQLTASCSGASNA